ncbi:M28 family metallopeptidase [Deminuibacter soli]|uniref:Aminopeptidase n=1 Tax=Deminuibacter soli TaxID=2291815 RepID=A0A3E1NEB8_9BACT|nr:M28 family peptidase [Deminuibacter soli]RFM26323.1 aminopeptidase [Deminuibacter soli]
MFRKFLLLLLPAACCCKPVLSQTDSAFARSVVDTLTGTYFWGRGYTNNGMQKAAAYLEQQFRNMQLQPLNGKAFTQPFSYPVNTFPGAMEVSINGKKLQPGVDYIVAPQSRGVKGNGSLVPADTNQFVNPAHRIMVMKEDKLTWSAEQEQADFTLIQLDKKRFPETPQTITADIDNKMVHSFATANIAGVVKGTLYPDSVIFITAHYDHLGGMGKDTYFPGANDNASGISLLLTLARYYAQHPQHCSIGFICFAGEEAGLVGSKYFSEHPLVPLKQIRFLLNLDLEGTGTEGITVVNATEYPAAFAQLQAINNKAGYLPGIKARGKAANSDHYWFSEQGVPAFFLYTMGGIKAYHDVFDRGATLPLDHINGLSGLLKEFVKRLAQ